MALRDAASRAVQGLTDQAQGQQTVPLSDAGQTLNRSFTERGGGGEVTNVITPMVIPERRTFRALLPAGLLVLLGLFGLAISNAIGSLFGLEGGTATFFGSHYWVVVFGIAAFAR